MMRFALVLGLAVFAITPARAAPVTYNFIGTLTYNDWPAGTFPYAIGDRLALSFTLQTDYPDADPSPARGQYYNPTGISGIGPVLAVDIGGTGGFGAEQYLDVFNDYLWGDGITYDWIRFSVGEPRPGGWQSTFDFRTTDLSVLSSDEIPTFIDPDRFEETIFGRGTPFFVAAGPIDEVVAVIPEPRALAILGSALLALMLVTRRWRRRAEPPVIAD
jgi:hypothetical protein